MHPTCWWLVLHVLHLKKRAKSACKHCSNIAQCGRVLALGRTPAPCFLPLSGSALALGARTAPSIDQLISIIQVRITASDQDVRTVSSDRYVQINSLSSSKQQQHLQNAGSSSRVKLPKSIVAQSGRVGGRTCSDRYKKPVRIFTISSSSSSNSSSSSRDRHRSRGSSSSSVSRSSRCSSSSSRSSSTSSTSFKNLLQVWL